MIFQNSICSSADILERRNLPMLAKTILALNKFSLPINSRNQQRSTTKTRTTTTTTATATAIDGRTQTNV
uniref:Uncharacterized protein n=1 Tax=Setaria digitata TaxID=48799 RepID=A0A915PYN0_9BILA